MTPQKALEIFDNLIDFKERFLYWENNKSLIQQSFIDLNNELNELVGKTDQESNLRRGNIFRELEAPTPIPKKNDEKAFVAKYWIDFYQKNLEVRQDPIYSFDHYRQMYENESERKLNIDAFIESEMKSINVILNTEIWKRVIKLKNNEEKTIKDFVLDLTNTLTIDYAFIYEFVDKFSYNLDYPKLARLIAPAQYIRFLEREKAKLASIASNQQEISKSSNVSISTNSTPKGFDLGYSDEQLTSLHVALINENYLTGQETDFINAFKGNPIQNKLQWIDKAQRNKAINIQTLLQLLFSLNINLSNDDRVIFKVVKDSINNIFSNDFGNINSKYNGFIESNTERQKTISSIVQKTLNVN